MDFGYPTVLIVPVGLGLLGFVEPCTIGGHLIFLRSVAERRLAARLVATLLFALVRALMMGAFGMTVALIGQYLSDVQSALWLVFGSVYLLIGLAYASDRIGGIARGIDMAPGAWKSVSHPLALGIAFGLSIPACAAPILFGLVGLAATGGSVLFGFATMAVFALALSVTLAVLAAAPSVASRAARLSGAGAATRWVFAFVFLLLGGWSLWFGLFVDPADWASL